MCFSFDQNICDFFDHFVNLFSCIRNRIGAGRRRECCPYFKTFDGRIERIQHSWQTCGVHIHVHR